MTADPKIVLVFGGEGASRELRLRLVEKVLVEEVARSGDVDLRREKPEGRGARINRTGPA
jgi:hypothetical protein